MNAFLYLMVEVLSYMKVRFPKCEIKTNALRLRDKLWNLSIMVHVLKYLQYLNNLPSDEILKLM